MSNPPAEIVKVLQGADRVLLATHIYPDGDALGSQLALGRVLESLGKQVCLYSEEPVNHLYGFLPGCDKLVTTLPDPDRFACAISVDCADSHRLGRERDRLLRIKPFIMVDHHAGHCPFGEFQWVEPGLSATGEMVYELAVALGGEIDYEAAYCLYTALVSDTGSFMYASTSAKTLRVAGDLVSRGVKPAEVAGHLFDNFTFNRLHLLRLVLESLEVHGQGRIAVIRATREMFAQTGTVPADTENFINYPRAVGSVMVAAFIKESRDNVVSVSLRSKGRQVDVAEVAQEFGGGGHRNAAGFKLKDVEVAKVRADLLLRLEALLERC
ncbi:MAG TPA: bifunctional oligoribonuclease/PAP phosphatase NrnA [Desulfurivibrionaceae bacterium]|nr:bifunctional oligoribonuclease/PAP phosphatase NrnA [Desulfurivibrionaceae bacterium]